jgi:hypothetical protein
MRSVRSRRARLLGAPAVALTVLLVASACGDEPEESGVTLEDINEEGAEDLGDVEALQDDAGEEDIENAAEEDSEAALFDAEPGTPVTIEGRIVQVFSPRVFVVGEGDMATLVTRPEAGDGLTLLPGYTAQVTGTVGTFVLLDVEQQLGEELPDDEFDIFQDGPYIAAEDVNLLDED